MACCGMGRECVGRSKVRDWRRIEEGGRDLRVSLVPALVLGVGVDVVVGLAEDLR